MEQRNTEYRRNTAILAVHRNTGKCLTLDKAVPLGYTFINSQFNYAPLIWMFCRKTLYHKLEKFIMELLKVNYQSEEHYENLLLESSSVSVHQRHLCFIVTEIYKSTTPINFEFMRPYFTFDNISFNLSKEPILYFPSTHSTYYGTNSVQEDPWFGTNFLGILNLANHYLNLKPKLRTLEILIADV